MGRACLLAMGLGMLVAGFTIVVGTTRVFVPHALHYVNLTVTELMVLSPHLVPLVPLIAHDRAGCGRALEPRRPAAVVAELGGPGHGGAIAGAGLPGGWAAAVSGLGLLGELPPGSEFGRVNGLG